jgi:hypothetical protein
MSYRPRFKAPILVLTEFYTDELSNTWHATKARNMHSGTRVCGFDDEGHDVFLAAEKLNKRYEET